MRVAGTTVDERGRTVPYAEILAFSSLRPEIVDGEVGFTGGVGIADNWDGNATAPDHWRDSHYRLDGPAGSNSPTLATGSWGAFAACRCRGVGACALGV